MKALGKSLLLALYSIGGVYAVTLWIGVWFTLDFRIWFIGLKAMSPDQFLMLLKYGVPLLLFFLAKGLLMHGQFRLMPGVTEAGTAWKWFLANAGINTLGIIVLILIQYLTLFTTGKVFWGTQALLIVLGLQFVLVNIVEALVSTYFYRRMGRIYAGAFANTLLITWFIVAGQATQYAGQNSFNIGAISVFMVSCVVIALLFFRKRTKAAQQAEADVWCQNL
ncbi:hypothetical protein [Paenibacillus xylanivorans]|uniref:hypothetical protein n=1 Tax=Paenibacillus xylanivorans TaxID=1705561 RepID=UPI0006B1C3D7|nr:hypothetical protein [Paenibacillus xylanivorans]